MRDHDERAAVPGPPDEAATDDIWPAAAERTVVLVAAGMDPALLAPLAGGRGGLG